MTTTSLGRQAENLVAEELKKRKFKILAQNWRTRWCEIDLVASKKNIAYLVEVKYRAKSEWGDGLDAITPTKLKQMSFAAELWVSENDWSGDYQLLAVSVSGQPPELVDIIEI